MLDKGRAAGLSNRLACSDKFIRRVFGEASNDSANDGSCKNAGKSRIQRLRCLFTS